MELKMRRVPGASVTLFADHYDYHPSGGPSDSWVMDSDFSYRFRKEPIKGKRVPCLRARYGDKELVPTSAMEVAFRVEAGTHTLTLVFAIGDSPYDRGRLVEDCGDGVTHTLGEMDAAYPTATIVVECER